MKAQTANAGSLFNAERTDRRKIQRRAVEAAIWGIPIVNFDLMFQAFARIGGAMNQIVYWSKLLDWKNQTTTPNPNSIYFMPFFDTAEIGTDRRRNPARRRRIDHRHAMDCWQTAFEDVGPAGVDKGAGRQISDPPARLSTGQVPGGYIAFRSDVIRVMACCAQS